MNYQLVLQFPGTTEEDFDLLIKMEDKLEENLSSDSDVDGHDFGSDEMNIFIYTNTPERCFEHSKLILDDITDLEVMKAAYRQIESEDFTILWPKGSTQFDVK